jgi:protein SCO1/2
MSARHVRPLRLALIAFTIAAGVAAALVQHIRATTPAAVVTDARTELGVVVPFTLTNVDSAPLTLSDLRGKVWIANLFFASCQSICPRLTHNLAQLQAAIGKEVPFDLLSVTVDPEHDTPAVMAAFAATYHADTNRWHFATAPLAAVRALATQSLHLSTGDGPVGHSSYVVLVDRSARIRGYYDGLDAEAFKRLAGDLVRVVAE